MGRAPGQRPPRLVLLLPLPVHGGARRAGGSGGVPAGGSGPGRSAGAEGSAASGTCAPSVTSRRPPDVTAGRRRRSGSARTARPGRAGWGPQTSPGAPSGGALQESTAEMIPGWNRPAHTRRPQSHRCGDTRPAALRETEAGGRRGGPGAGQGSGQPGKQCAVYFSRNAVVSYFIWDGVSRDKAKPVQNAEITCLSVRKAT